MYRPQRIHLGSLHALPANSRRQTRYPELFWSYPYSCWQAPIQRDLGPDFYFRGLAHLLANYYTERGFSNTAVMDSLNRVADIGSRPWPDASTLQDPDALLQLYLSIIPEGPAYQSAVADIWGVMPEVSPPRTPVLGPTPPRGDYQVLDNDGFKCDISLQSYTARNNTPHVDVVTPLQQNPPSQNPAVSASPPTTTPQIQLPPQLVAGPALQSSHSARNYTPLQVRPPYLENRLPRRQPSFAPQEQANQQGRERLGQSSESSVSSRPRRPGRTGAAVRPPLVRFNNHQPSALGGGFRLPPHTQNSGGPRIHGNRSNVVWYYLTPAGSAPQPSSNNAPSAGPYGNPPPGWGFRPIGVHSDYTRSAAFYYYPGFSPQPSSNSGSSAWPYGYPPPGWGPPGLRPIGEHNNCTRSAAICNYPGFSSQPPSNNVSSAGPYGSPGSSGLGSTRAQADRGPQ
ncbi:hypothetical protein BGX38DRAFT_1210935 [Terfezia claveryi]|nr:hypothetical protein BGX38DRAFT_1210935 [Terfezia claveryi]